MSESGEASDGERSDESDDAGGVPVRVEPDAAVVSMHAQVPPDAPEELPAGIRPLATLRAVGGRLRRAVGGRGDRTRSRTGK